ncbi:MAG: glyoxalase/bleomycin resistance/extradiol dioxygenase family protein [Actinobacteria bacterium HGW-Actinobacteria-4]|nr:MAG: glyoxalase/bleomycin resistance/extradiol dioxygenase family protein [Actinobacteria bacterium HGW-Actinobacteria-4]
MAATLRIELFPTSLAASVTFYSTVLQFEVVKDDRPHGGDYVAVGRDGVRIGLGRRPAATATDRQPATAVEIVIEVDDVEAERDHVLAAGWKLDADLVARPWGVTDFRILDPDGYYLRITERH